MSFFSKLFGSRGDISGSQTEAEGVLGVVSKLFDKNEKEVSRLRPMVDAVGKLGEELRTLSDDELKTRSAALRARFREEVTARLAKSNLEWQELETQLSWDDAYVRARLDAEREVLDLILPEAFALVREAGDRTIGLRHFDVQLIGGAVLHSGKIAEMRTGEGKTLVATLPAYLNALTGRGVHCVTVNDYLAERDANWMRPIYEFLGLTVAFLQNDMDAPQRQAVYASDIVYGTNSEFGFDYLRDNMAREPEDVVARPLNFAIIDEVDNILIDEARTPLIISAQVAKTDRALRRQQMAKTCDGVARKLMPAISDREVEAFIEEYSTKNRVDIGALADGIMQRGAFKEATDYLIDSYLLSERTARTDNAAHLLETAEELFEVKLIDQAGREALEAVAVAAAFPAELHAAWRSEVQRLLAPFERALREGKTTGYGVELLSDILTLPEDVALEISDQIGAAEDHDETAALLIADEVSRRGLVDPSVVDEVAGALALGHDALVLAVLQLAGPLADADALLQSHVPQAGETMDAGNLRKMVAALEEVAARELLPFETMEKLWGAVQLKQGRDGLRKEICKAIEKTPGTAAVKISEFAKAYLADRQAFLGGEAASLKAQLGGYDSVANRAGQGENAETLRDLLQKELARTGPFAQATKATAQFVREQTTAYGSLADHLMEEMAQWVEVPRDGKKVLAGLLAGGGEESEVAERLGLAVRDLPGDNYELLAIAKDTAHQLQTWRDENAVLFTDKIHALMTLPEESQSAIRTAIEDGAFPSGFEAFVGRQLLNSEQVAPLAAAIEAYGERWRGFIAEQNQKFIDQIAGEVELGGDARDDLADLMSKPLPGALDRAIYEALAADAVARHLEPLLTEENSPAFTEEVKRRIPLSKDLSNKLKPAEFTNRSAGQLSRSLQRLVVRSLEAMPFEDYKRVVKNLGWLTEKDEKRRTSAPTDMGTLVAEREAARPVFTDPENFLEALLQAEILTEEEAVTAERAQAENPGEQLSATIDRVLRLPSERRRRLAEAKLQEVQPVLDQAVKAHCLFEYNVNYIIGNGKEIVIVDENTGRTMPGRRFSEGLHEALEAKHGLEVQIESQTVATITIQNYFRLYNKLSGLTGTAKTEETEFAKTYRMEVITVPTNKPVCRKDMPDQVYKTAEAKLRRITFDILEHHCNGQPVLVGTRSVEMSERMSNRLTAQALQALVLAHIIKRHLMEDKKMAQAERDQILAFVRQPLHTVNPAQIKALAKNLGVEPEVTHDKNVDELMGQFDLPNIDRNRFVTALRQGLPHNVLNAKNHRNEARIIAEAARPGAVTIATNMAGRGVDIILGGSLDSESRWRVICQQLIARALEGKSVHVRSRNAEATGKLMQRLTPDALQQLAWAVANTRQVEAMEKAKSLEGQAAKELKDALGSDLVSADFANRVRSRARRFNLLETLPVELTPIDDRIVTALVDNIAGMLGHTFSVEAVRNILVNGLPAQEHRTHAPGREPAELALLFTMARPMGFSMAASEKLLGLLGETPDLDRGLLELVAAGGSLKPEALAANLGGVTVEWVTQRLLDLGVPNSEAAREKLKELPEDKIEVNEFKMAAALGEQFMGLPWLRQRLTEWQIVGEPRVFPATQEMKTLLQDENVVYLRLDKKALAKLRAAWALPARRRDHVGLEAPNLVLLQELAGVVGPEAPFLSPEWLHAALTHMGIIGEGDVMKAQMMAQVQDEKGNQSVQPLEVLVYRLRLTKMLDAIKPVVREVAKQVGESAEGIYAATQSMAPWLPHFTDADWIKKTLAETPSEGPESLAVISGAPVQVETGVAGQSADIVLESEARPEDIAHTSDQEEVKGLGGLHVIGTERHESRRIDNQLRGRAGRQGDPGTSRFYVSLEDELWRLFGVRGQALLRQWDEDDMVEAGMISKSIERAQKKVELNHFESRKHVLQYDDVMNVQREVIYRERSRALMGEDIRDTVLDMSQKAALAEADKHCPRSVRPDEWDTRKFYLGLGRLFGLVSVQKHLSEEDLHDGHWVERPGSDITSPDFDFSLHNGSSVMEVVTKLYEEREDQIGTGQMRSLERWQVRRSIDEHWMEHLAEMDYLRDAIWQQGYAQKEPIGVFRQEGFELFQKMLGEIRREVTEAIFGVQLPNYQHQQAAIEMGELTPARLLEVPPMDDGIDDGTQLDKDADGEDETATLVHMAPAVARNAPNPRQGPATAPRGPGQPAPGGRAPEAGQRPLSRAERRAKKRK